MQANCTFVSPHLSDWFIWFMFFSLHPLSPSFVFQEHWWSWSQLAVTMPATSTASSQCSCVHSRRWCGNTWAPSKPTQGWQKPAQVHTWMWIQLKKLLINTQYKIICLMCYLIYFINCCTNIVISNLMPATYFERVGTGATKGCESCWMLKKHLFGI